MRSEKGITLVALVITIIVMLILVTVSVVVALNGGLFDTARDAKNQYETKQNEEKTSDFIQYEGLTGNEAINAAVRGTV